MITLSDERKIVKIVKQQFFTLIYSQTCVQQPPSGPLLTGGRCSEFNVIKIENWT
jgi:hypothetical protein